MATASRSFSQLRLLRRLVCLLEAAELTAFVKVVFEAGNVSLVAVVALELIEHFHEYFQDRGVVITTDSVVFLVDVEQHTACWRGCSLLQLGADNLIFHFRQEDVGWPLVLQSHAPVAIEQQRENLEQMRFTATEETGYPDAISGGIIEIAVNQAAKSLQYVACHDVLDQFHIEIALVVGLDHPFNGPVNGFGEEISDRGCCHGLVMS